MAKCQVALVWRNHEETDTRPNHAPGGVGGVARDCRRRCEPSHEQPLEPPAAERLRGSRTLDQPASEYVRQSMMELAWIVLDDSGSLTSYDERIRRIHSDLRD